MFWGSHSGLSRRTNKAVDALIETAPQAAHLRVRGTVILGPALPTKQEISMDSFENDWMKDQDGASKCYNNSNKN